MSSIHFGVDSIQLVEEEEQRQVRGDVYLGWSALFVSPPPLPAECSASMSYSRLRLSLSNSQMVSQSVGRKFARKDFSFFLSFSPTNTSSMLALATVGSCSCRARPRPRRP